jgi:hypothetical protein
MDPDPYLFQPTVNLKYTFSQKISVYGEIIEINDTYLSMTLKIFYEISDMYE